MSKIKQIDLRHVNTSRVNIYLRREIKYRELYLKNLKNILTTVHVNIFTCSCNFIPNTKLYHLGVYKLHICDQECLFSVYSHDQECSHWFHDQDY